MVAKASSRLLMTVAASLDLPLATRDVAQAYVCTTDPLLREVYLVPPSEAGAGPDELWRLRRSLYGLPEAGAMWYATYARYHRTKLGMRHTATDPAAFIRHTDDGRLDGLSVLQMDDSPMTGSTQFMVDEQRESADLPSKGCTTIGVTPHDFNCAKVSRSSDAVVVEQFTYTARLNPDNPRTAAGFATERGKASYATASTRPDQARAPNKASQVRADEADAQAHEELASALKNLNRPIALRCPRLDFSTAEI